MASDQQLSDVLSEFARTMLTDFPIQGILDHLVKRIVDVLPITAAGVTLIAPDTRPHYVAASDQSALRFEKLQTELGEGHASPRTGQAKPSPWPTSAMMTGSRCSDPARWKQGSLRCSRSLCGTAMSGSGRSICTGAPLACWTQGPWRRRRPWPTSRPPIS
jgi:hypothetical protein